MEMLVRLTHQTSGYIEYTQSPTHSFTHSYLHAYKSMRTCMHSITHRELLKDNVSIFNERMHEYSLTFMSSDQFAWANGQFENIFVLNPNFCAGQLLQPFFGIVGTAVALIAGSFIIRNLANVILPFVMPKTGDDEPSRSTLNFGIFEYAIVRTAHLGMCQAGGYALATAIYTPICGQSAQIVWALTFCWLLSLPVGFTMYLAYKLTRSRKDKEIKFFRKTNAGSWSAYFSEIYKAEGCKDKVCRPHIVHYVLKTFFALLCALFFILTIVFVSNPSSSLTGTIVFFIFGVISLIIVSTISFMPGRRLVVLLTNILAYQLRKKFVIVESGAVLEMEIDLLLNGAQKQTDLFSCSQAFLRALVWWMAWIQAKIETSLDDSLLWDL